MRTRTRGAMRTQTVALLAVAVVVPLGWIALVPYVLRLLAQKWASPRVDSWRE
jgi:hypothetical protein